MGFPAGLFKATRVDPTCACGCVKSAHVVDGLGRGACNNCGLCEGFNAEEGDQP